MDVRLDGKIALISGGSRGLGKAMAQRFAEAGATVALLARRADVLEETASEIRSATGAEVRGYPCDVSQADAIARGFDAVQSAHGRVDILVNNAGRARTGSFEEISDAVWQEDLDLKLLAAVRFSRSAWPGMKARRWGRIINVLNSAAKAPRGGSAPTAVSRAAGMALTKVMSHEGAPHGILVNALCPGIFVTDQWHDRHRERAPERSFEAFIEEMGRPVPLGRMGDAIEFANMACFLASDAASYVTGTAINVDGGSTPTV